VLKLPPVADADIPGGFCHRFPLLVAFDMTKSSGCG
jgi:hypothetical protein